MFKAALVAAVGAALCLALTCPVMAQVQRTFVSTSGSDSNTATNCAPTTPCRSFGAAIGVTKAGGEIVPVNSGGYGAVTITKSLQIITPPGVYAGITTGTGNGITIAAAATDTVVLKGLTFNGLGTSGNLIEATLFGTLHIEHCEVANSGSRGIEINTTAAGNVYINDTIVRDNGDVGLYFKTTTAPLNVSVDNVRSDGNHADAFFVTDGTLATVSRSSASRSATATGFLVLSTSLSAELNCDTCIASNNHDAGFRAFALGPTSTMRVTRSTAADNGQYGFWSSNGSSPFETFGTNLVRGNTTANTSGTITNVPSL